jgi:predicted extracellular nuclease
MDNDALCIMPSEIKLSGAEIYMYKLLQTGQGTVRFVILLLVLSIWIPATTVFGQDVATDLIISEYIEGSSNNKAIEIYNGTGAPINLGTGSYNVQMFFNGNPVSTLTINLTGTVAHGDVFVLAQSSANATILAQADQTNGSGWFNGDDAVVLRKGTTVIDSLGQAGVDPGTEWGAGLASTADNTLRRKIVICSGDTINNDVFDPAVQWDGFATDTFAGLGSHTADCAFLPPVVINEIQVNTIGTDWEFVEVTGTPGLALSSYTLIGIESDTGTLAGTIDKIIPLSGVIPDDGFWWAASPTGQATYLICGTADSEITDNSFENSSATYLLVEGFTGTAGTDLDTNNDGVLDSTPWTYLLDSIAIVDSAADFAYTNATRRGPDGTLQPSGVYRNPDKGDWSNTFLNFNDADGTPGVSNLGVCEPPPPPEPELAFIHEIQGTGTGVVNPGTAVIITAIVTADFSANDQLDGFYVQEEDADADANPQSSEGIFVYCGNNNCGTFPAISVGDKVTVTGVQEEAFEQSQINVAAGSIVVNSSGNPLPTPASVTLPVIGEIGAFYEPFEGMLVSFNNTLYVAEYFELFRFGEVVLYEGGRPYQYTHVDESPTPEEFAAYQALLASRRIIIGDDNNSQNSSLPDGVLYYPQPDGFSNENFFRGGDTVSNLTGVLGFAFGEYNVLPVAAYPAEFVSANPRPAAPISDGSLTVASFNVLNYFQTIDTTASTNTGHCGPDLTQDCRGADSAAELEQQTNKLVTALLALNADIYGLVEMENTTEVEPLEYLVDVMNAELGTETYAFVDTGVIGSDAIRVGIIYNTTTVAPVGVWQALEDQSFVNPFSASIDRNRPALAQSFREYATGGVFTVVVNHFKSKGSGCGDGDDSAIQGNCNGTRTAAAHALLDWLLTDPTGVHDSDYLLVGDYNAYANEDPIKALEAGGYADLNATIVGTSAYSYVFDGQLGYLDYALSSSTLTGQVEDIAEWHINADEVPVFDYNDDVRTTGEAAFEEEPDGNDLTENGPYRTSDHDPVFVGMNLIAPTFAIAPSFTTDEGTAVELEAVAANFNGTVTISWDLDNDEIFEVTGNPISTTPNDGPAELLITVQACDELNYCLTAQSTITVNNVAPTLALYTVPQAPLFQGETVRVLFNVTDPGAIDTATGFTISASCTIETLIGDELDCAVPTTVTSWSITGTAVDKDGGSDSETLSDIIVLNTHDAINYVIGVVQATPGLNNGQKNALITKLLHIQQQVANGNDTIALNQLTAFMNQVVDLQTTGVISVDAMNNLLTLADRLAQSIQNS